jgi:hypothetical protein
VGGRGLQGQVTITTRLEDGNIFIYGGLTLIIYTIFTVPYFIV